MSLYYKIMITSSLLCKCPSASSILEIEVWRVRTLHWCEKFPGRSLIVQTTHNSPLGPGYALLYSGPVQNDQHHSRPRGRLPDTSSLTAGESLPWWSMPLWAKHSRHVLCTTPDWATYMYDVRGLLSLDNQHSTLGNSEHPILIWSSKIPTWSFETLAMCSWLQNRFTNHSQRSIMIVFCLVLFGFRVAITMTTEQTKCWFPGIFGKGLHRANTQ